MLLSIEMLGCASRPVHQESRAQNLPWSAVTSSCIESSERLEELASIRGLYLSDPRPLTHLPFLAANRFLAELPQPDWRFEQKNAWLDRLLAAGERRQHLLHRLLDASIATEIDDLAERECLPDSDRAFLLTEGWEKLLDAVSIDDEYSAAKRFFGIYGLFRLPVQGGISDLHRDRKASFVRTAPEPSEILAGVPNVFSYSLPAPTPVQKPSYHRDALGIQGLSSADLARIYEQHAPRWEIEHTGAYDVPGRPQREGASRGLGFAGADHLSYVYPSLTWFAGAIRFQLNYVIWFESRPASSPFDLLSGKLDGLHWRVTLDENGRALIYDSMHSCGCYHSFYTTSDVRTRTTAKDLPEPPLVLPIDDADSDRLTVRLKSRSHYVGGVYQASSQPQSSNYSDRPYQLVPYEELYFDGAGRPSGLFDRHGIIDGSERGERHYLWPLGIRSPGAMRERGRHATAFVGRRHFDDGTLLDELFVLDR
ncbi:MAG: hypothetical protein AAF098_01875 [Pseudomonadota bacterium]